MTEIEKRVAKEILFNHYILSSEVRKMIGTDRRIVLTKDNFPNIRHLLSSHMTAFRRGMYRGGMKWVSVISAKDEDALREYLKQERV